MTVPCDLCGSAMPLPAHCADQGVILGLLVCSQCVEDALDAQPFNARCEAGITQGAHP